MNPHAKQALRFVQKNKVCARYGVGVNPPAQIVFMQSSTKKILLVFLITFVLFLSLFLFSQAFFKNQIASLSGMITAWVTINPLEVDVSVPAKVEINRVFKVTAEIINKGGEKIKNAKGEIFLPDELKLVKKNREQKIGVLTSKGKKFISWSVKGKESGNYIILVKASGELRREVISAEDSAMVKIKNSRRDIWPLRWFRGFLDFFRGTLGY